MSLSILTFQKCAWYLCAAVLVSSCTENPPTGTAPPPSDRRKPKDAISWVFEIQQDNLGSPAGTVSLLVNGAKHVVLPEASSDYRVLERNDYPANGVPAVAETAAAGWWAGAGDVLYVSRVGDDIHVYRKEIDEEYEGESPFHRILTIRSSR